VPGVVAEALGWGADLLVTHHPLLLQPVHGVPATTWKGRVVHDLVRNGSALFTAHTNADVAQDGVNDALAAVLGLVECEPLRPRPGGAMDKLVTYVPPQFAEQVVGALTAAGAGTIGGYTGCAWSVVGEGTFLPGPTTTPLIGRPGAVEHTPEARLEMVVPRERRAAAVRALLDAHPYEEVAYDLYELVDRPSGAGLGRVGSLERVEPLAGFARRVAAALPATRAGVRFHGDPSRPVSRVAVCGGSGDSLLADAARAGVDAFVTADLRHHPASEHLADGGPALVDPGHWASEWPWLPRAAARLLQALAERGTTVETYVSTLVTDPVTGHVASRSEEDR
jgi:dinuclear metal center YbgI/SA1388 family protein